MTEHHPLQDVDLRPRPDIIALFTLRCSTFAAAVEEHTHHWVDQNRLVSIPRVQRRLRKSPIGEGMGRSYPDASQELLELFADMFMWLTAFSDIHVDEPTADDNERIASRIAAFVGVLDGRDAPGSSGFTAALADLTRRMHTLLAPRHATRVQLVLRTTLLAWPWEGRSTGNISLDEYLIVRPYMCFGQLTATLIEPGAGIDLGDQADTTSDLSRLNATVARLIAWSNDIYSFAWEYHHSGTIPRTLPLLIAQHRQCSLASGAAAAMHMVEEEALTAHALISKLATSPDEVPSIARYTDAVDNAIASNFWWWHAAERYRTPSP